MSKPKTDIIGQKIGKWTVISLGGRDKSYHQQYLCRCECGHEAQLRRDQLVNGLTMSCTKCANRQKAKIADADPEAVREYLKEHSVADAMRKYEVSRWTVRNYMKEHDIPLPPKRYAKPKREQMVVVNPKKPPEALKQIRREWNTINTVRSVEGVTDKSPHEARKWRYSGQDYLRRLEEYREKVSG